MNNYNLKVEKPNIWNNRYRIMMKDYTKDLLSLFSSSTRCKIIEMLREGYDHPDDIAEELGITRQAVDKHLIELHDWGLVERNAVFPPEGRPRIIYELTKECNRLTKTFDKIAEKYKETMIERAEEELEKWDIKLAEGEISEKVYKKKIKEIKRRWDYDNIKGKN